MSLAGRGWLACLAAAALLPYVGSLANGFVLDDNGLILLNDAVRSFDLGALWTRDYWFGYDADTASGLYRPVTLTTFAIEQALAGDRPWLYHGTNVLLHMGISLLAWALFRRVAGEVTAAAGALLFAVLPAHSEAVFAIAGRADLLSTAGLLASLLAWSAPGRRRLAVGGLFFAAALLAKEQAVVLPGLLLALAWWQHRTRQCPWPRAALLLSLGLLALYLAARWLVLGTLAGVDVEPLDNPLVELSTPQRMLAALAVGLRYAGLLVLPARLSADYSVAAIDVHHLPWFEQVGGLLLGALAVAALLRFARRPDVAGLSAAWLVVAFAPVANVLFPIGTILGERLTYAPSVGFCLGGGWALAGAIARLGRRGAALTAAVLLVLGVRTAARAGDWRDEESLFRAVVEVHPDSARGRHGLGQALFDAGRLGEAERHYRRAIEIYPRYDTAYYNLGILLLGTARPQEALDAFDRSIELQPAYARAHLNRGVALFMLGRRAEAETATRQALRLRPGWELAQQNLRDIQAATHEEGTDR